MSVAVVPCRNDLAFDLSGYTFVLLNDISTTCNGEQEGVSRKG